MNDFLTKEIELCGDDIEQQSWDFISQTIYDALREKGIDVTSFSWSLNVEYFPQEIKDES